MKPFIQDNQLLIAGSILLAIIVCFVMAVSCGPMEPVQLPPPDECGQIIDVTVKVLDETQQIPIDWATLIVDGITVDPVPGGYPGTFIVEGVETCKGYSVTVLADCYTSLQTDYVEIRTNYYEIYMEPGTCAP